MPAGRLLAVNYAPCSGGGFTVARYDDADTGGRKQVTAVGTSGLSPVGAYTRTAGNTHCLAHTEAHVLVNPGPAPAATLVIGPARRAYSRAFLPSGQALPTSAVPPRSLERHEARAELLLLARPLRAS